MHRHPDICSFYTCMLLLALGSACDRGRAEPVATSGSGAGVAAPPVPAKPDASVPIPIGPPTAAVPNLRLVIENKPLPREQECTPNKLVVRLVDNKRTTIDEFTDASRCEDACTAEAKEEAAEQVREIERGLDTGASVLGELDYNFTGCLELGPGEARLFKNVGGRDVVIFEDRYRGPHDSVHHALRLAVEICGKLLVTDEFGAHQDFSWKLRGVSVAASPDGKAIEVTGTYLEKTSTISRLGLPVCPAPPTLDDLADDPRWVDDKPE